MATPLFFEQIRLTSKNVGKYKNPSAIEKAKSKIPRKFFEMKLQFGDSENHELEDEEINLLKEFIGWFKLEFFKWLDKPDCSCNTPNVYAVGTSSEPISGQRVEYYRCESCKKSLNFVRHTDVLILMDTCEGRCGEWANCFTFFCTVLGYDARYVLDATDHAWTEIFLHCHDKWIHCDPCEGVIDSPLMYENGWKKNLTYVIAYNVEEVQDVTWRYVTDFKAVLSRRNKCNESDLIHFVLKLSNELQKQLDQSRIKYLTRRRCLELADFLKPPIVDKSYGGRVSGALEWRISRNEYRDLPTSATVGYVWVPNDTDVNNNEYMIKFSTAQNKYQISNSNEALLSWDKGVFDYQNIFLKVEHDWKQTYLCRIDGTHQGSIVWKFECGSKNCYIGAIELKCAHATFSNGDVKFEIRSGDRLLQLDSGTEHIKETEKFLYCSEFTIHAILNNGTGSESWQHAQLFRQSQELLASYVSTALNIMPVPNPTVPKYGWKVNLDHVFPEKRKQDHTPSVRVIFQLLTLIIRYVIYTLWMYIRGRKPVMDYIKVVQPKQIYGVPLGGIGGGTIGRGFKGEFCRFQLKPGMYEYQTIDADQFLVTIKNANGVTVYQNVLSTESRPKNGSLSSWKWNFPGSKANYTALYPRSWTEYDISEFGIKLICKQISPVIPNNYKDSCVPGGVFIWTVENFGNEPLYVSITFTLKSYSGNCSCDSFQYDSDGVDISGIQIYNLVGDMKCTFSIAVKKQDDNEISTTCFNPKSNGESLWDQLKEDGKFANVVKTTSTVDGLDNDGTQGFYGEIACAVSTKTLVNPNESKNLEFSFIWDMPKIHFRGRRKSYMRYYTKYFNTSEKKSYIICHYALSNYHRWEYEIEKWQDPVLNDMSLPDWYKSAIFNELYYISDGGTIWLLMDDEEIKDIPEHDARREYGRFAYLEGHEYRMYNTYDVHFYASFALADLWPKLQATIQYEFNSSVNRIDNSIRWYLYNGKFGRRKYPKCIPHDLGDPDEDPFLKINSYPVHNVTNWRDLNLKFVLQCYRDYVYTNDEQYLLDMWPQIKLLMDVSLCWDTDGDGMIENSDYPDQTYDCWSMTGVSAYIGSLWLASLYCTIQMANILKQNDVAEKYIKILDKAKAVYDNLLWNGEYYIFDTAQDRHSSSIMADQLCGIWYLCACNVKEQVLPTENIKRALNKIFDFNVCKFNDGTSGAVNGMSPDGQIDGYAVQSEEVWTGVTYALASLFIFQGMREEGFKTAKGVYDTVYNVTGMGFETPEALYQRKSMRSVGYMRPLSIWSMQKALEKPFVGDKEKISK